MTTNVSAKAGNMISEQLLTAASWLFWLFYVIFLASSIPHLADWFRHTDGIQTGHYISVFYWVLAYGKAVAIDGADVLLTLAFMRLVSKPEKSGWDKIKIMIMLALAVFFTTFSWYLNWQYEVQHMTTDYAQVDAYTNFFGWNVGNTNAAVGSALQLFALIFTFIADTLLAKTEAKSLDELRQELADKQERETIERQLAAYKPTKKSLIQRAKETAIEAKSAFSELKNSGPTDDETQDKIPTGSGQDSDDFEDELETETQENYGQFSDKSQTNSGEETGETLDENQASSSLPRTRYISISDASAITGYAVETLKKKTNPVQVKFHSTDKNRILTSSIRGKHNRKLRTETGQSSSTAERHTGPIAVQNIGQISNEKQAESQTDLVQEARRNLDFVEKRMLQFIENSSDKKLAALRELATTQPLDAVVKSLQDEYPTYAGYITKTAVANVMVAMGIRQTTTV